MIIQLERICRSWHGTLPNGYRASFCDNVLDKLGASGKNCKMIVRFNKNPKKKGFIKVKLYLDGSMWCWDINPTINSDDGLDGLNIFLGTTIDSYLSGQFDTEATAWVKFETA